MKGIIPKLSLLLLFFHIVFMTGSASAVTYQTGVGVGFTFNPTLSINLSSADILIPNLAPGNSSDSNTITVTVNTNTAYGYTLNATVGEATNYNTRNLIRSDINDSFSSIAYGSSLASLTTDNTWGYAYKPSGQSSTWTTYSGLPLYSDTNNVATLISTQDPADSDSVEFKIAAKASTTQPAGDYKNVINFIAVSNPGPLTDLTNTSWYLNAGFSPVGLGNENIVYNISFESDNEEFNTFVIEPLERKLQIAIKYDTTNVYVSGSSIVENYRTLTITGGADVCNSDLIEWLQNNATRLQ